MINEFASASERPIFFHSTNLNEVKAKTFTSLRAGRTSGGAEGGVSGGAAAHRTMPWGHALPCYRPACLVLLSRTYFFPPH